MKTYSQAGQDLFVVNFLKKIKNGIFVDIAAGHPTSINNTYLLESEYDWDGISIEIDSSFNDQWKNRKTKYINANAFEVDYRKEFDEILNKHNIKDKKMNYLSLDLEPPELTNKLLHFLPLQEYKFDVITYEHDLYRVGDTFKNDARNYLENIGYKLEKNNAGSYRYPFEDWYVLK
jgi:hypothetical protein